MGKAIWMWSVWFNVLFLVRAQAYNTAYITYEEPHRGEAIWM